MEKKLKQKEKLLQESLSCTFIACPCSSNNKAPNMELIFKLRKKIIELRDLCAIQECEITSVRNSVKFVKTRELMVEIEALRQLLSEQVDPAELEAIKRQLTDANEQIERLTSDQKAGGNVLDQEKGKFKNEQEKWAAEKKELLAKLQENNQ